MATTSPSFTFTSDAESFTFTPGGNAEGLGQWSATGGNNDAGCIETYIDGRNKEDSGYWGRTLTFEDMGVPAGATVTGITSASYQTYVNAYVSLDANPTVGPAELSDGSTTVTLAQSRSVSSTDGSYQAQSGVNNTSLSWSSSQSVTIYLRHDIDGANNDAKNFGVYLDDLTFTITYTEAASVDQLDFERGVMRGIGRGIGRGI